LRWLRTWNRTSYQRNEAVFPSHIHERCELLFLQEGSAKMTVSGETYILEPGNLVVISPMELHHLEPIKMPYTRTGIYLDLPLMDQLGITPSLLAPLTRHAPRRSHLFDLSQSPAVFSLAETIHREFVSDAPHREQMLSALVHQLLIGLYRLSPDRFSPMCRDEIMESARTLLEQEFSSPLSVEGLASRFGFTPSHFIVRFKRYTGYTPYHYRNLCRITKARQMLQFTDRTVTEISEQCGFGDVNSFVRCFRSVMHLPPGEYRKLSQGDFREI